MIAANAINDVTSVKADDPSIHINRKETAIANDPTEVTNKSTMGNTCEDDPDHIEVLSVHAVSNNIQENDDSAASADELVPESHQPLHNLNCLV